MSCDKAEAAGCRDHIISDIRLARDLGENLLNRGSTASLIFHGRFQIAGLRVNGGLSILQTNI